MGGYGIPWGCSSRNGSCITTRSLTMHSSFRSSMESGHGTSQQKKVSFRKELTEIAEYYRDKGGFSAFYTEYRRGMIPVEIENTFRTLIKKVRAAITDNPIQHLGYSQHGFSIPYSTGTTAASPFPGGRLHLTGSSCMQENSLFLRISLHFSNTLGLLSPGKEHWSVNGRTSR